MAAGASVTHSFGLNGQQRADIGMVINVFDHADTHLSGAPCCFIEQGPPEDLVANFDRLFREKVEATRELAREAARAYGLLPELS